MNYPVCVLDTWMIQHGFHSEMQLTIERLEVAGGGSTQTSFLSFATAAVAAVLKMSP